MLQRIVRIVFLDKTKQRRNVSGGRERERERKDKQVRVAIAGEIDFICKKSNSPEPKEGEELK